MKKFLLLLPVLLLTLSCGNSNDSVYTGPIKTIKIDVSSAEKFKDLSYMYDTSYYKIVALETRDDALLGNKVTDIFYRNGRLYIAESQSNALFMFDDNGKFIKKIHNVGEGPMDYRNIGTIHITDDRIYLIEQYGTKVLCYDMDLNYIGQTSLKKLREKNIFYPSSTFAIGDKMFYANVYCTSSDADLGCDVPYKICSTDMDLSNVKYHLPIDKKSETAPASPFFLREQEYTDINGKVHLMCSSYDTIYVASRDTIVPEYVFDFGENQLPSSLAKTEDVRSMLRNPEYDKYVRISSMKETNRYMIFSFVMGGRSFDPRQLAKMPEDIRMDPIKSTLWLNENQTFNGYNIFYDKIKEEATLVNGYKIEKFAKYRLSGVSHCDGDYMISVEGVSPYSFDKENKYIVKTTENHPYPAYEKDKNEVLKTLTPNSKPVVYIYKLK